MWTALGQLLSTPRGKWLLLAVMGCVVIAAYHNSFDGPAVMDDYDSVLQNASIRQLWPLGTVLWPPLEAGVGGRPLANLSFALNFALGEHAVTGYHITNLALHLLTMGVLFGVVRRTLQTPLLCSRYGREAQPIAATVALLWAIHPLHTITVNYLSQRTELLMSTCYTVALYALLRDATGLSRRWRWLAVAACAAGMASKEVMVTAPVALLLYDRVFLSGSWREVVRLRWALHLGCAATWILLGLLMAHSRPGERGIGIGYGVTVIDYLSTECRAILLYLKLVVWPGNLIFDHGMAFTTGLAAVPFVLGLTAVVACTLVLLRRHPPAGFGLAWFFLLLLPSSSVVPLYLQPVAESRPYLASAGLVAAVVIGAYRLLGPCCFYAVPPLLLIGSTLTLQRNLDYQDDVALWSDTVVKNPRNPRAHINLSAALSRSGRADEAAVHAGAAVKLQPDSPFAWTNLGAAFYQAGVMDEAIRYFSTALKLQPEAPQTHCNLADALLRDGQTDRALAEYQQSLKLNPVYAKAHRNYSLALRIARRLPEALSRARKAVDLEPTNPDSLYVLGSTLLDAKQAAESIPVFEAALRLRPNFPEAEKNLQAARKQVETK